MPEAIDKVKAVTVYEPDLEQMHETLSTVYHFCLSYDLFNQYKNLSNSVTPSPLTKQVGKMRNRVKGYLDELEENVSE
jgi:hypothetical protein